MQKKPIQKKHFVSSEQGFSLVELVVVMMLLAIMATIAFLGMSSNKLFDADTQAFAIIDILQEARQKALTQGKTLRVELNDTKKQIRLIDENSTTVAADDVIVQARTFNPGLTIGVKPSNVNPLTGALPQSSSPVPEIQYTQTNYPMSANDKVKTLRFLKTGEVVDGGTDNLGTGAINTGVTIYVYNGASGSKATVIRAITVSGITAAAQLFKCHTNEQGVCTGWIK
jgi:type II secretion system protein H